MRGYRQRDGPVRDYDSAMQNEFPEGAVVVDLGEGRKWVHLKLREPAHDQWLRDVRTVPRIADSAMLEYEPRPRWFVHEDAGGGRSGLLAILRGVNLNPGFDPEDMVGLRMWVDSEWLVSTSLHKVMAVTEEREYLAGHDGAVRPAEVLVDLANRLTEKMRPTIEGISELLDDYEERVIDPNVHLAREQIAPVRRRIIGLRRFLVPQKDVLEEMSEEEEEIDLFTARDRQGLLDASNRVQRHIEELDAAKDRAVLIQEEAVGEATDRLNKRLYVLTIVTTLFLPLGFITGLLGINVGGIPLAESARGFLFVCLILAGIAIGTVVYFRWSKWF